MKLHGSLVVLICCFLLQFSNFAHKRYTFSFAPMYGTLALLSLQGLTYLVYPLLGHLADVYLTRYRMLKCGIILLTVADIGVLIYTIYESTTAYETLINKILRITFVLPSIVIVTIAVALFEANAIQFGLDQLLEASTPKLISFIHWYYWSQNVAGLVVFFLYYSAYFAGTETFRLTNIRHLEKKIEPIEFFVFCLCTVATLILFSLHKKHLYIQRAGLNPFKNIYRVLKYAWKHKVPEHRSAFTYWEEDIPPRIDLGKDKYGGPFTTEEVEDTKTFLRILPLLLCLFGYHLAGDGYSAPQHLLKTSCPSLPVLLLIVINPLHMSALVIVAGIPLYRLVIVKVCPSLSRVLLLTRMWIGVYLSLLQVVLYIIVVVNHDTVNWKQYSTLYLHKIYKTSLNRVCLIVRAGYVSNISDWLPVDSKIDNTYLWFIIPQLLNGLSSLLVSMTVFEFICAQAPRTTQGLLIGLWYATFSIRYLVVGVLDNLITERMSWLICEGVKGFLILVSLVLFSCVSRHYRYRKRDEIVNIQAMIEDTHERWLDQEEEYMQERRAFYQNFNAYSTISPS